MRCSRSLSTQSHFVEEPLTVKPPWTVQQCHIYYVSFQAQSWGWLFLLSVLRAQCRFIVVQDLPVACEYSRSPKIADVFWSAAHTIPGTIPSFWPTTTAWIWNRAPGYVYVNHTCLLLQCGLLLFITKDTTYLMLDYIWTVCWRW